MKKNMTTMILSLMLFLTLSGCAGISNHANSTDHDDRFYHHGWYSNRFPRATCHASEKENRA